MPQEAKLYKIRRTYSPEGMLLGEDEFVSSGLMDALLRGETPVEPDLVNVEGRETVRKIWARLLSLDNLNRFFSVSCSYENGGIIVVRLLSHNGAQYKGWASVTSHGPDEESAERLLVEDVFQMVEVFLRRLFQ